MFNFGGPFSYSVCFPTLLSKKGVLSLGWLTFSICAVHFGNPCHPAITNCPRSVFQSLKVPQRSRHLGSSYFMVLRKHSLIQGSLRR